MEKKPTSTQRENESVRVFTASDILCKTWISKLCEKYYNYMEKKHTTNEQENRIWTACLHIRICQPAPIHTHTQSHSHTERASTHSLTERETERMRARIFELNGPNSFASTYRVGIATATAEFEPSSSIRKIFYLSIRRMCASHGQGNQTHHPTNESKHTL